jgi:hypothetical protein
MEAACNLDTSGHTPDVETSGHTHYVETAEHDVEATGHTPDVEAARHDVEAARSTPGVEHTYAATRALGRRAAARVVCRKYLWRDYVNDFNESSAEHAGVRPLLQGAEPRTSASRASVGRRAQLNPTQLNPTQSRSGYLRIPFPHT